MGDNLAIYNYLRLISCCRICCLRFLNGRVNDFINVEEALAKRNIVPSDENEGQENPVKKVRENTCTACLGLFESNLMDSLLEQVGSSTDFKEYDCQSFSTSINLPIALHLRQLSIWISLLERFPAQFEKDSVPPYVTVKDAFKAVVNRMLEGTLGKQFSSNSVSVLINLFFEYEKEEHELKSLHKVKPEVFTGKKATKQCRKGMITRNAFEKHFTPSNVSFDLYRKHIPVPPAIPETAITLEKISYTGPTLFLAGRYNKISRELSQTPWVIEGKRKMENCVQEIMTCVVAPYFRVPEESLIFSSSGREDVDVRCLGEGRPFVLEIPNAVKDYLEESAAADMEAAIDKSKKVSVKDLQLVDREELVHIKHGEENKQKYYRALCVLEQPVTLGVLQALNIEQEFVIDQWTPLRVLHRRALLSRPRTIHSVKAYACKTNDRALIVDVVTQAGTYVKELVHSDFGRTKPSFKSIIGQPIDIHALDVMAITLDWPKKLRR